MKLLRHFTVLVCFSMGLLFAQSTDERIDKMEKIINSQQAEIEKLKQLVLKGSFEADVRRELGDVQDRLDMVETRSYSDKLELGLRFNNRVDNFSYEMADGSKSHDDNIWSTKASINIKAKIDDSMKFTGRLTMYKFWADSTRHEFTEFDSMQGRTPTDSSIFFERAFLDWQLSDGKVPLFLTIGRQPSADGPSYQFSDNTTRKSTYSALVFDGASDGIVGTAHLENLTDLDATALRIAYGKGYQDDVYGRTENPFIGSPRNALSDNQVYGLFFESTIPGFAGSLYQLGYVMAQDVVADARAAQTENKTLGDISFIGAMVEFPRLWRSNLDLFAHFALSRSEANGNIFSYDSDGDGTIDKTVGLLSDDGVGTHDGNAFWIGGRYSYDDWLFGVEYNHGSQNWISISQGSRDVFNKLATRGDAYEAYVSWLINRFGNLKLGWVVMDSDYTGSGWHVGQPLAITTGMSNGTDTIKRLSDIYLQMQILF